MNDAQAHERVHKLLHEGKISTEEANALLEALTDQPDNTTHDTAHITANDTATTVTSSHSHVHVHNNTHGNMTSPTPPTPPAPPHQNTEKTNTEKTNTGKTRANKTQQDVNQRDVNQREVEINLNGEIGNAFAEVLNNGFRYAFGTDKDVTDKNGDINIKLPDINLPDINLPNINQTDANAANAPTPPFVHVHNRLGNVTIHVDSNLSEPAVKHDDNAPKAEVFRPHDQDDTYPEDVFMVRLVTHGDSNVHIPEGYAVYLDSGMGNVRIHDVQGVFGTINAGNVKATGVSSLKLVVNAGNANIEGHFMQGEHRLVTNAGNAKVVLQDGSSLAVHARVTAGNIRHKGTWQDITMVREMVGGKLEGRINTGDTSSNHAGHDSGKNNADTNTDTRTNTSTGNANLTLKAKAGNITIYAPDTPSTETTSTKEGNNNEGNSDD